MKAVAVRAPFHAASIAALVLAAFSPAAYAQDKVEANGTATAEVLEPIRAIPIAELSFGTLSVSSSQPGSVRVKPDSSETEYLSSASPQCTASIGCLPHPGAFAVSGEADRYYSVTIADRLTAIGSRTGTTLLVTQLSVSSKNQPALSRGGQLDLNGEDVFYVGGTLEMPAGTQSDLYHADLPLSVTYN